MRLSEQAALSSDPIFIARVKAAAVSFATGRLVDEASSPEEIAHGKQVTGAPDHFANLYAPMLVGNAAIELISADTDEGDSALFNAIQTEIYPSFVREIFVQWREEPTEA